MCHALRLDESCYCTYPCTGNYDDVNMILDEHVFFNTDKLCYDHCIVINPKIVKWKNYVEFPH